jgi:hypothetical protein
MAEGWVELHKDDLTSVEGINSLNRMLRLLFDLIPGDANNVRDFNGYGSPESVVSADIGSTYRRLDGGATTTLYVKTSGTGAVGWTPK